MKSTIVLRMCTLALGLVLSILGVRWLLSPGRYRAAARLEIEHKADPGVFSDPWFIPCEFEVIGSQLVLSNAVRQLNLGTNAGGGMGGFR